MSVSIDPRFVSELLKIRLNSSTDITAASLGNASHHESPTFAELLSLLISSSGEGWASENRVEAKQTLTRFEGLSARWNDVVTGGKPDYDSIIQQAAERFKVDPSLVKAVIQAESGFRSDAVSPAGAKGLMQLMDATAASLGVTDPFDPAQNVNGGTRFLSFLLTKYNGNVAVALAAYNAGPGRIDRLGIKTDEDLSRNMDLLPKETQRYIGKVLGNYILA